MLTKEIMYGVLCYYSTLYGIDPKVSATIVQLESSGNPTAKGKAGEIGLMQLLPSSFPDHMPEDLYDPITNVREGVRYLSIVKRSCRFKSNFKYVICYNRGPTGGNKVVSPKENEYYLKFMSLYKKGFKEDGSEVFGNFISDVNVRNCYR